MLSTTIFNIKDETEFEQVALQIFQYQYKNIAVYRRFCTLLKINPSEIKSIADIPFLPIQFFKTERVYDESKIPEIIFTSSGTTGSITSKHFVANTELYIESFYRAFTRFYGPAEDIAILALLPSYQEREGSSLIYMVDYLVKKSTNAKSGFYLNNDKELIKNLQFLESSNTKTLLIGVSFALLDLIEKQKINFKNLLIMETGGMKGRRKEMVREELHEILKAGFGVQQIHSEYGMTELLSQAYSTGNGIYHCTPWMRVYTRDTEDALSSITCKSGGINIIDLANIHSCSFIATQDLGRVFTNGSFEILGRFDSSDIRGCNLLVL